MKRRSLIKVWLVLMALVLGLPDVQPAGATSAEATETLALPRGKAIVVNIGQQRVYAYNSGKLVLSVYANIRGLRRGTFRVQNKIPMGRSFKLGWRLPHWMGIYYGSGGLQNGFHGASINKRGGRDMTSLGCIVMRPGDAARLYGWASVGTPVYVR
jgi:lipoprotein-anchoring transpeptidase ErfK/SrfK